MDNPISNHTPDEGSDEQRKKDERLRFIRRENFLSHKQHPDISNKSAFEIGQYVELCSIEFRIVEISATRVVLATRSDPQVNTWHEEYFNR